MRVAVVGSGVSGLAATWLINNHSEHEVHLYESDSRPGGHANTADFPHPKGKDHPPAKVDTAFMVFNPHTYPNFLSFLNLYPKLRAAIQETEMTFCVSRDDGAFEWAGKSIGTFFSSSTRLLDRRMWRLLYDILRFNACARTLALEPITEDVADEMSIGDYLKREGYSDTFADDYLMPMTAAIWSTPPDRCALDFPARTLLRFMSNHYLLQLTGKPSWLTLGNGSQQYVKQILSTLPSSRLHLNTRVKSVESFVSEDGTSTVRLTTASGATEVYDYVIMACHTDAALDILKAGNMTDEEERVLSSFRWNINEVVLHHDLKLMPKRHDLWSCWNYLTHSVVDEATGKQKTNINEISATFDMNQLQHISRSEYGPVLISINPPFPPDADKTVAKYNYDHPVMDHAGIVAQREMIKIQNKRGIAFAGAWMNYGFHEDGFTAGLRAAQHLPGVKAPFKIRSAERPAEIVSVAFVFEFLQSTGIATSVGNVAGFCLDFCSALLVLVLGTVLGFVDEKEAQQSHKKTVSS